MPTKSPLITALAAALLAACSGSPQPSAPPSSEKPSAARAQPVSTSVGVVTTRTFETRIRADGEVTREAVFPVVAETSGTVQEVLVEPGSAVKAGQRLVVVDMAGAKTQLLETQADLRRLSAQLLEAHRVAEEYRTLREQDYVSKRDLERAESALKEATAQQAAAHARLEAAQRELRRTEVLAPFEGVVASRAAKVGGFARAGEPLLELRTPSNMSEIALRLPESALGQVKEGTELTARVGTQEIRGRVLRVEPTITGAARTFTVYAVIEQGALAPGQSIAAHLIVSRDTLPSVPESAILLEGSRSFVFEVKDGVARQTQVLRQYSDSGWVGVEGLPEGARIALSGAMFLRDGAPVTEVTP